MREISIAEAVNRRIFGAVKAINMASNGTLKVRSIVRFRPKEETDLEAAIAVGDAILARSLIKRKVTTQGKQESD